MTNILFENRKRKVFEILEHLPYFNNMLMRLFEMFHRQQLMSRLTGISAFSFFMKKKRYHVFIVWEAIIL